MKKKELLKWGLQILASVISAILAALGKEGTFEVGAADTGQCDQRHSGGPGNHQLLLIRSV